MSNGISEPYVRINNDVFKIVPNSARYKRGSGERTVRANSTGGGGSEIVVTTNGETRIGEFMCDIYTTVEEMNTLDLIIDNESNNYIALSDGDFQKVITNAVVTNDPERNLSHDGVVSVEIKGDPAE